MDATLTSWWRTLAVVSMVLCGCGGGGGEAPPSCLTVYACGGDLIGTWRFLGACTADIPTWTAIEQTRCPSGTVGGVGVGVSGTITFNADLTYRAAAWNTTFSETSSFDERCGDGTSCADRSASVTSSDGSFAKRICSGSGVCACSTSSLDAVTETGTYTTSGFQFELVGPTSSRTRDYCVENGSLLHIVQRAVTSTDPTATTIVVIDGVAARQ